MIKYIKVMVNRRCQKAFNEYIEEQNKPKTYGSGGSTYYPHGGGYNGYGCGCYNNRSYTPPATQSKETTMDFCTLFFYEWSNLRMGAKTYNSKKEFFKFLESCNIAITDSQKKQIEETRYRNIFATCVPNKPQLMIADTWYNLNQLVEAHIKVDDKATTVKNIP